MVQGGRRERAAGSWTVRSSGCELGGPPAAQFRCSHVGDVDGGMPAMRHCLAWGSRVPGSACPRAFGPLCLGALRTPEGGARDSPERPGMPCGSIPAAIILPRNFHPTSSLHPPSFLTWNGRIFFASLSHATASPSSTREVVCGVSRAGRRAAMSGYLDVMFSEFLFECEFE